MNILKAIFETSQTDSEEDLKQFGVYQSGVLAGTYSAKSPAEAASAHADAMGEDWQWEFNIVTVTELQDPQ